MLRVWNRAKWGFRTSKSPSYTAHTTASHYESYVQISNATLPMPIFRVAQNSGFSVI